MLATVPAAATSRTTRRTPLTVSERWGCSTAENGWRIERLHGRIALL